MNTTYFITSIISLFIGISLIVLYKTRKQIKYIREIGAVGLLLTLIGITFFILSFTALSTPSDKSPVLIGMALAPDTLSPKINHIDLSSIIDTIDIFWDWQPSYVGPPLYDIDLSTKISKKYVPMIWGDAAASVQNVINYIQSTCLTKYVFSWNEPDMLGSIMAGSNPPSSTSAGFWMNPFVYGNAIEDGTNTLTNTKIQTNTSYKSLAMDLNTQAIQLKTACPEIQITTPVMAMAADISRGCAGLKPIQKDEGVCGSSPIEKESNIIIAQTCGYPCVNSTTTDPCTPGTPANCQSKCGTTNCNGIALYKPTGTAECQDSCWFTDSSGKKHNQCICNGWLSLVKNADSKWWDNTDIINIHCYSRFAHAVKLHLLEYIFIFYDSIVQRRFVNGKTTIVKHGKELWLTEVACIYSKNESSNSIKVTTQFVNDLLWNDTTIDSITCNTDYKKYDIPDKLPGLRTNTAFTYKGISASWYEHGFGALTWFTANNFAGFNTGCGDDYSAMINSNIWTNGNLNDIYRALTR